MEPRSCIELIAEYSRSSHALKGRTFVADVDAFVPSRLKALATNSGFPRRGKFVQRPAVHGWLHA